MPVFFKIESSVPTAVPSSGANKIVGKFKGALKTIRNVVRSLSCRRVAGGDEPDGVNPAINAVYGFSHHRGGLIRWLMEQYPDAKIVTIDEYNLCLGISSDMSLQTFYRVSEAIKQGTYKELLNDRQIKMFSKEYKSDGHEEPTDDEKRLHLQREKVVEWFSVLHAHQEDLDIARKLARKIEAVPTRGWLRKFASTSREALQDKQLEMFVKKNGDASYGLKSSVAVQALKVFSHAENYAELVQALPDAKTREWLEDAVITAFFRQTSKIGLEWFVTDAAANELHFVTGTYEGGVLTKEELYERWWAVEGGKHKGRHKAPITFSELRKVGRDELDVKRHRCDQLKRSSAL
ncbi:hypothetical protein NUH87_30870 [Pseudomonas batumici]|uniref:hypothetical protein n=1 Tax=Pseudomonas batumici TaxID=226910 RepID=UPI0030CEA1A3